MNNKTSLPCPGARRLMAWVFLIAPASVVWAGAESIEVSLADPEGVDLHGPHRFLTVDGRTAFDVHDDSDTGNGPVIEFGRIGLRQMDKTKIRYRNFVGRQRGPYSQVKVVPAPARDSRAMFVSTDAPSVTTANRPAARKKHKPRMAAPPPTFADVRYGPHERNVLDFWQAQGEGPRPLLVFIHGGGWTNGDKANQRDQQLIPYWLGHGISYAAINYRFTSDAILPAPVHDAARAVQFLRGKAAEWNLDKRRVAAFGGSAGACTSMWLLLHDDLADPSASDPVLRESTRLCAVAAIEGQTTLDPKTLEAWLGPNVLLHRMPRLAVGERSSEAALANYEQHRALFLEFSPIHHVDRDDPPLFMEYRLSADLPCKDGNHGIHHPVMGMKLKEKSDAAGHECHLVIRGDASRSAYPTYQDFLVAKLVGTPDAPSADRTPDSSAGPSPRR